MPISTVERLGNTASNSEEALTSLCSIYPAQGSNPKPSAQTAMSFTTAPNSQIFFLDFVWFAKTRVIFFIVAGRFDSIQ